MDPLLELYRKELVVESGRKLDKARMIRFDERTGYFASTDLGRTASHFYIKYNTIEVRDAASETQDVELWRLQFIGCMQCLGFEENFAIIRLILVHFQSGP